MATLLIVEDDKQTNEAICEYLKSAGHKIVPAFDGVEALKIFEQGNIDLVILDIMLRSVYKELHADHETGAADNK